MDADPRLTGHRIPATGTRTCAHAPTCSSSCASRQGGGFRAAGRLVRGYRVEDVDRFVDTVAASIRTIGPADVRNARFAEARGGYAQDAVDDCMDRVENHVAATS